MKDSELIAQTDLFVDEVGEFLRQYDEYLEGKRPYSALPSLRKPPSPPAEPTAIEIVERAEREMNRAAMTAAGALTVPVAIATWVMYALNVPVLVLLGAQQAIAVLGLVAADRYWKRKDKKREDKK